MNDAEFEKLIESVDAAVDEFNDSGGEIDNRFLIPTKLPSERQEEPGRGGCDRRTNSGEGGFSPLDECASPLLLARCLDGQCHRIRSGEKLARVVVTDTNHKDAIGGVGIARCDGVVDRVIRKTAAGAA